jgi:ABC-2 type transport system permease protein
MSATRRTSAWSALVAFMVKEARHLLRDRQTLLILLCLPVAQLALFGFAVRTDIRDVRIGIVSPRVDAAVTALRSRFSHNPRFTLLPPVRDTRALEAMFHTGDVDVGVVLPSNLAEAVERQISVSVQLIADGTDPNTGAAMQTYARSVLDDWQRALGAGSVGIRLEPRVRMRFNPTLASVNLFVPGLTALILTLVTTLMTALSLSREKERGSFEILLVSPLRPWQIILGKLMTFVVLALLNLVTIIVAAWLIFQVPFRGSLVLLVASSTLFAAVGLALGVVIAALTNSQLAAMLAAVAGTMLPNTLLSGLIFPIASMPLPLQIVSIVVPARWFVEVVRGIMLKGAGVAEFWPNLVVLAVMLGVFLLIAVRKTSVRLG